MGSPIAKFQLPIGKRQNVKTTKRQNVATIVITCAACIATGCDKNQSKDTGGEKSDTIVRTASDGPVTLTMSLSPAEVEVSERARLEIRVAANEGTSVQTPDHEKSDELQTHRFEFRVQPVGAPETRAEGGKRESIYRYNVDFFLPGEYELPPARLTYASTPKSVDSGGANPSDAAANAREVRTESIKISVRAASGKELSPEELSRIQMPGPVELKKPFDWRIPIVVGVAVIVLALILRAWLRLRAEIAQRINIVPADVWAKQEFARLLSEGLLERRLFRDFYYRVSGIVRGYIERRFSLAAPEMTTEEFLAATVDDSRFAGETQWDFRRFLDACDMVKYAKYAPQDAEVQAVLRTAMEFVERTKLREETEQIGMAGAMATQ
ncbi:MAG: hypothetical protein HY287_05130 [Planctomycetes bacterium]|nr:hypothetical protein [Planctomycetota bacterium]